LRNRGITDKTIRKFGLGWAADSWDALKKHLLGAHFSEREIQEAALVRPGKNSTYDQFRARVMFPIIDLRGNVIGFGGRIIGSGAPKYLNSSDTPVFKKSRGLYALNFAKSSGKNRLLLTEGYMDTIALHQAGIDNAVATLGTALTGDQARLIAQYTNEVVIAYDSDAAGQTATRRAAELFGETGLTVRVLSLQGAKDPDEYIRKFGPERFVRLLEGSKSAAAHEIEAMQARFDLESD
jgi:DNA primase